MVKERETDELEKVSPNMSWSIPKLKEYLRGCGGRLSGGKSELVERLVLYDTCGKKYYLSGFTFQGNGFGEGPVERGMPNIIEGRARHRTSNSRTAK